MEIIKHLVTEIGLATPETMRRRAERVVDQLDLHRRFRRIKYPGALRGGGRRCAG